MSEGGETDTFEDLFGPDDAVPVHTHPVENFIEYWRPSGGAPLRVRTVGFHVLWANYLWNGARWMGDHIDMHPEGFAGKTVLELGAAAGLPSILAVHAGAKKVGRVAVSLTGVGRGDRLSGRGARRQHAKKH